MGGELGSRWPVWLAASPAGFFFGLKQLTGGVPSRCATGMQNYWSRTSLYATDSISVAYQCGTPRISGKYLWHTKVVRDWYAIISGVLSVAYRGARLIAQIGTPQIAFFLVVAAA